MSLPVVGLIAQHPEEAVWPKDHPNVAILPSPTISKDSRRLAAC